MQDISVLIVSYNSGNYLNACIESILNADSDNRVEIIVVDNNSSDNSRDILLSFQHRIIYIQNNYNYGFAKAMNQAYKKAGGRYILTFNPDAELAPEAIDKSLEYFSKNPDAGLIAPVIRESQTKYHYPNYNLPVFDSSSFIRFFYEKVTTKTVSDKPVQVDFVYGTGLIADAQVLEDQLYPESTFLFWEEYYLCEQVKKNGRKIYIVPDFVISHHRSVSFKTSKEKIEWMQRLILPYGFFIRVKEHGRLFAVLNYVYKSIDNLLLWWVLELGKLAGLNKYTLRLTAAVNARLYLKSIFMSYNQALEEHQKAMIYFNQGKERPSEKN